MREKVFIALINSNAIMPSYAHSNDAGMDICASEDTYVKPGQSVLVPTGLKMAIPDGYEMQIRPRSGLSLNTMIRIPNSPGTIDSGYRDEIKVIVYNASSISDSINNDNIYTTQSKGNPQGIYLIRRGDRIAQMVFASVIRTQLIAVDSLDGIGNNRNGGFGSTGISDRPEPTK
jgi:dUTP pyrophosphatase